jgi:hypothetical protein
MNLHTEWLSPNFHDADAYRFELLMLALPLLLAFSRRRAISLMALTTSVVWLHFAFSGQRYVALWVLISVPLMARLSTDILYRIGRRRQWSLDVWRTAPPRGGLVGVGVILLGLLAWARWTDGYAQHHPKHIPVDALTYVLDHHAGGTVFHDYGWGGWLTWHGWPGTRNWIDDRNEVQGQAHIEQYLRIMQTAPGWREALAKQGAQAACIPVDSALAECLAVSRDWSERYRDNYAVVFEHVPRQAVGSAQPERTELGMHP